VNKLAVFNAVESGLSERDAWQGRALGHSREDLQAAVSLPGAPAASA
jgi:hypothetical protein